jgi:hypothetical protein
MARMTKIDGKKDAPVRDNFADSDRQAGMDQRGGNESRDIGGDPDAAGQESVSAADSLRAEVEQEDKEEQAHPRTGEELGIEVRHPSDGGEAVVDPDGGQ